MPRSSAPAPRTRLTAAAVVEAAVELSGAAHLLSWSIRDLAGRLGTSPSSIYHHVGGKDRLCREVAEHVVRRLPVPEPCGDWRAWFRRLLLPAGPLLMRYPGVAAWFALHGPTVPAALPIVERGFRELRGAGFGADAVHAFALLFNTALLTVSLGDERLRHEEDGARDHAAIVRDVEELAAARPGLRFLPEELLRPLAEGGERALRARMEHYRFAVETVVEGLAAALEAGRLGAERHREAGRPGGRRPPYNGGSDNGGSVGTAP
ncbi:MAG: TetR/AcrR family transcriptional regulator [Pseudoclavibacter sp.]|nr:TetR/AcrR family transcriptional regulator [Pseudoclavibacter sp.]